MSAAAAAAAAVILSNSALSLSSPFRKLMEMWHPQAVTTAPKTSPTPFSIEDILQGKNRAEENNQLFNYFGQQDGTANSIHQNSAFSRINLHHPPGTRLHPDYGLNDTTASTLLPELTNVLAQHMVASSLQMQQQQQQSSPPNEDSILTNGRTASRQSSR